MLTEELRAEGMGKTDEHEDAAHQKRNWVRLTYDCNDNCIFCLDSDSHDGEIRGVEEVKEQILDGRRKGAERLILSGGEPTIHPRFLDFVKLGRMAGYAKVQTVTNGRMFRYKPFITKCIDAGLQEITFSIHGHNAKIHDALVGVKGAFEQEVEGLKNALADGRPIINIDVCVNRGNVKTLNDLIQTFYDMGVKEYDLLHVIPFGRAYTDGRDTLFYDLDEQQHHLTKAFEWSRRPDMHIWLNRFPVRHLEGFEELIQDPYKLNDEIRGRKEEYGNWIETGERLDCREPTRCGYCYLKQVCDTFEGVHTAVTETRRYDAIRVDTQWESAQQPVFGGDPATARRAAKEAAARAADAAGEGPPEHDGRLRLPLFGNQREPIEYLSLPALAETSGAETLIFVAPTVASLEAELTRFEMLTQVALELDDYGDLGEALADDGTLCGRRLISCYARTKAQADALFAIEGDFEVIVALTKDNEPWLLERQSGARLALRQLTWERMSESRDGDLDLHAFFGRFELDVPLEGVPACVSGRAPRPAPETLDTAMTSDDGKLEIFRFIKRYILAHYMTKSLRCNDCAHEASCQGMHVNYIRAHGFEVMRPIAKGLAAPEAAE